jgi:hypothetical protein
VRRRSVKRSKRMKILSGSLEESVCREVCVSLYKCGVGDSVESMMLKLGYGVGLLEGSGREVDGGRSSVNGVILPWCGEVIEGNCVCLKLNSGLHTQCRKRRDGIGEYCNSCSVSVRKNGGVVVYGTVSDRLSCGIEEYKDNRGKKAVSYMSIMRKLNISRLDAEREAGKLGWVIPECHFEEIKRGRPKKAVKVDEKVEECSEKKKRGRPRKEKEVVSNRVGEDLIASLLTEQVNTKEEVVIIKDVEKEEEEEEETKVIKVELCGKMYLRTEGNMLYDCDSHDAVGMWNEEKKSIDELEEE